MARVKFRFKVLQNSITKINQINKIEKKNFKRQSHSISYPLNHEVEFSFVQKVDRLTRGVYSNHKH